MKRIFIRFYDPQEVVDSEATVDEIKQYCFRVNAYNTEEEALMAYANTPVTWSTLLEDNINVEQWINEAYKHIETNDIDWLEENFT